MTSKLCEVCGAEYVDRSTTQHGRYCSKKCKRRKYNVANVEARREYNRLYYAGNKEAVNERNRKRAQANPEARRKYDRNYRETHPEAVREKTRKWRAANPEAVRDQQRKWREENREYDRERKLKWRADNPEAVREYSRAHYAATIEAQREAYRAWVAANPEARREKDDRRRARKKDAFVEDVDRKAIYARDSYTCQICGKKVMMNKKHPDPMSPSIDHILPLSKGGTHEPRNVQLTHLRCNLKKNNRGVVQLRLIGA